MQLMRSPAWSRAGKYRFWTGRAITMLLAAVELAACASSERPPAAVPATASDSTLGPGDTFEVSVYGEADLSGKHQIAEDGTIDFPLIGRIDAAGLGPAQIAGAIRTALTEKGILRDPHVSVLLLEQTSKQVSVVGAVARPGRYPVTIGMTVIEAIGAAGGLTALASGNSTIVTRRVDGQLKRFKVQVESISEGRVEDFKLHTGDIVFVPERIF
jgi:protein involved in polysaccharide export with SLBB domain